MKKAIKNAAFLLALVASASILFVACKKDYTGKYEMTDGNPTVYYVRPTDATVRDSLLTGALLGETVCIVGDNLTSVQRVLFNDKEAILNINYVTRNTLIVTVPRELPGEQTDMIYFHNKHGEVTTFDFTVFMPVPVVRRIVCEIVPEGGNVVITGDYFFDDDPENSPVTVKVGSYEIQAEDIVGITDSSITFKAPPADVTGQISVTTMYGTGSKSMQIFRDDRGLITGFEEGVAGGWGRPTLDQYQEDPEYALTGKYLVFEGALNPDGGGWVSGYDVGMIANIWPGGLAKTDPLFTSDPATSVLRFEAYVVNAWSGAPMVFLFDASGTNENSVWGDEVNPRGFWVPWLATGSYTGGGWETISIPISECVYSGSGKVLGEPAAFGQLTIMVSNRGMASYDGTPCTPKILIDNIRVVPAQ